MIEAEALTKTFFVHRKAPGLAASIRSLFLRRKLAKEAVRGVSFRVDEGELVGLVGANGAGKTTLVKMLAGIIHPTSGDARVLGFRPWERDNRLRRRLSLIMGQKAQLWWDLPAADCFLLLKEIYRLPDQEYAESLDYLATLLQVEDLLEIQVRRLSLGERMKMELIAALLHRPRVVFLDEPTIGLDLSAQRAIRTFLLQYLEDHRPAMILTSHYMEDIESLCERILILREGELVYDGTLSDVVRMHADTKVLTAHFPLDAVPDPPPPALAELGAIEEWGEGSLRLSVPRNRVAGAASRLLKLLPVADLTIEEPEISTIIERILRARGGGKE